MWVQFHFASNPLAVIVTKPQLTQGDICVKGQVKHGTGVCRPDSVHSLTTKQIPSLNIQKRNYPYINQHSKVTRQSNSNVVAGSVFCIFYEEKIQDLYVEKSLSFRLFPPKKN